MAETKTIAPAQGEGSRGAPADSVVVTVFFIRAERAVPVRRIVPALRDTLQAALAALLAGPTAGERDEGFTSWFSAESAEALRSVETDGALAVVDLHDLSGHIPNASSALGSTLLLDALNATVFANASVDSVEYRFDGSCDRFGEFVQRGCIRYGRAAAPEDG